MSKILIDLFARIVLAFMLAAGFAIILTFAFATKGRAAEVHIFRGLASPPCCTAMDRLATQLLGDGHIVHLHHCSAAPFVAFGGCDTALDSIRTKQELVLIGHSNGGTAVVRVAQRLKAQGKRVALLVAFDPTRFVGTIPSNVREAICFCRYKLFGLGLGIPNSEKGVRYAKINAKHDSHLSVATNPVWVAMVRRKVRM